MPPVPKSESDIDDVREDIGGLMAELASRPQVSKTRRKLTGPERAAVLMLALGENYGGKIFSMLDDDELREISIVMSQLGSIEAEEVEQLLLEFVGRLSASGALLGNYDATERLLQQYLPKERVGGIMDEIRGPAGRNMWEKLANVQEEVLRTISRTNIRRPSRWYCPSCGPSTPPAFCRSCPRTCRSTASAAC